MKPHSQFLKEAKNSVAATETPKICVSNSAGFMSGHTSQAVLNAPTATSGQPCNTSNVLPTNQNVAVLITARKTIPTTTALNGDTLRTATAMEGTAAHGKLPVRTLTPIDLSKLQQTGLDRKIAELLSAQKQHSLHAKRLKTEKKYLASNPSNKLYKILKPSSTTATVTTPACVSAPNGTITTAATPSPLPSYRASSSSASSSSSSSCSAPSPPVVVPKSEPIKNIMPPKITVTAPEQYIGTEQSLAQNLTPDQRLRHVKSLLHKKILQKKNDKGDNKNLFVHLRPPTECPEEIPRASLKVPVIRKPPIKVEKNSAPPTPNKLVVNSPVPQNKPRILNKCLSNPTMLKNKSDDNIVIVKNEPNLTKEKMRIVNDPLLQKYKHIIRTFPVVVKPPPLDDRETTPVVKLPTKPKTPQKSPQDIARKLDFQAEEYLKKTQYSKNTDTITSSAPSISLTQYNKLSLSSGPSKNLSKPPFAKTHKQRIVVPDVSPLKSPFPTVNVPKETPLPTIDTFKKPYPMLHETNHYTTLPQAQSHLMNMNIKPSNYHLSQHTVVPSTSSRHTSYQMSDLSNNSLAPNSLVVLENKVLSQDEMIDMTSLGLSKFEQPTGFSKPHKPIIEIKEEQPDDTGIPLFTTNNTASVREKSNNSIGLKADKPANVNIDCVKVEYLPPAKKLQRLVMLSTKHPNRLVVGAQKLQLGPEKIASLAKQIAEKKLNESNFDFNNIPIKLEEVRTKAEQLNHDTQISNIVTTKIEGVESQHSSAAQYTRKNINNINLNFTSTQCPQKIFLNKNQYYISPPKMSGKPDDRKLMFVVKEQVPETVKNNINTNPQRISNNLMEDVKPCVNPLALQGVNNAGELLSLMSSRKSSNASKRRQPIIEIIDEPDPADTTSAVDFLNTFDCDNYMTDSQLQLTPDELNLSASCSMDSLPITNTPFRPRIRKTYSSSSSQQRKEKAETSSSNNTSRYISLVENKVSPSNNKRQQSNVRIALQKPVKKEETSSSTDFPFVNTIIIESATGRECRFNVVDSSKINSPTIQMPKYSETDVFKKQNSNEQVLKKLAIENASKKRTYSESFTKDIPGNDFLIITPKKRTSSESLTKWNTEKDLAGATQKKKITSDGLVKVTESKDMQKVRNSFGAPAKGSVGKRIHISDMNKLKSDLIACITDQYKLQSSNPLKKKADEVSEKQKTRTISTGENMESLVKTLKIDSSIESSSAEKVENLKKSSFKTSTKNLSDGAPDKFSETKDNICTVTQKIPTTILLKDNVSSKTLNVKNIEAVKKLTHKSPKIVIDATPEKLNEKGNSIISLKPTNKVPKIIVDATLNKLNKKDNSVASPKQNVSEPALYEDSVMADVLEEPVEDSSKSFVLVSQEEAKNQCASSEIPTFEVSKGCGSSLKSILKSKSSTDGNNEDLEAGKKVTVLEDPTVEFVALEKHSEKIDEKPTEEISKIIVKENLKENVIRGVHLETPRTGACNVTTISNLKSILKPTIRGTDNNNDKSTSSESKSSKIEENLKSSKSEGSSTLATSTTKRPLRFKKAKINLVQRKKPNTAAAKLAEVSKSNENAKRSENNNPSSTDESNKTAVSELLPSVDAGVNNSQLDNAATKQFLVGKPVEIEQKAEDYKSLFGEESNKEAAGLVVRGLMISGENICQSNNDKNLETLNKEQKTQPISASGNDLTPKNLQSPEKSQVLLNADSIETTLTGSNVADLDINNSVLNKEQTMESSAVRIRDSSINKDVIKSPDNLTGEVSIQLAKSPEKHHQIKSEANKTGDISMADNYSQDNVALDKNQSELVASDAIKIIDQPKSNNTVQNPAIYKNLILSSNVPNENVSLLLPSDIGSKNQDQTKEVQLNAKQPDKSENVSIKLKQNNSVTNKYTSENIENSSDITSQAASGDAKEKSIIKSIDSNSANTQELSDVTLVSNVADQQKKDPVLDQFTSGITNNKISDSLEGSQAQANNISISLVDIVKNPSPEVRLTPPQIPFKRKRIEKTPPNENATEAVGIKNLINQFKGTVTESAKFLKDDDRSGKIYQKQAAEEEDNKSAESPTIELPLKRKKSHKSLLKVEADANCAENFSKSDIPEITTSDEKIFDSVKDMTENSLSIIDGNKKQEGTGNVSDSIDNETASVIRIRGTEYNIGNEDNESLEQSEHSSLSNDVENTFKPFDGNIRTKVSEKIKAKLSTENKSKTTEDQASYLNATDGPDCCVKTFESLQTCEPLVEIKKSELFLGTETSDNDSIRDECDADFLGFTDNSTSSVQNNKNLGERNNSQIDSPLKNTSLTIGAGTLKNSFTTPTITKDSDVQKTRKGDGKKSPNTRRKIPLKKRWDPTKQVLDDEHHITDDTLPADDEEDKAVDAKNKRCCVITTSERKKQLKMKITKLSPSGINTETTASECLPQPPVTESETSKIETLRKTPVTSGRRRKRARRSIYDDLEEMNIKTEDSDKVMTEIDSSDNATESKTNVHENNKNLRNKAIRDKIFKADKVQSSNYSNSDNVQECEQRQDEENNRTNNDVPATPSGSIKRKGRQSSIPDSKNVFNSRLLLVTKRELLDTDEVLTDNKPSTGNIQCGLCSKRTVKSKWQQHLAEHYGVGWKQGDEKLNINSRSVVLNCIINFLKDSGISSLLCRMCGKSYRSGLGILSHIENCGIEQKRQVCPYCQKDYTILSFSVHKRACFARMNATSSNETEIALPADTVFSTTGRAKRLSTLKAESRLKEIGAECQDFNPMEHINYDAEPLEEELLCSRWSKEIAKNAKAVCPAKLCKFSGTKIDSLLKHVHECKHMKKPGYYCTFCKNRCFEKETEAVKHVVKFHGPGKDFSDDSDCNIKTNYEEEDEEHSSDSGEADDDVEDEEVEETEIIKKKASKKRSKKTPEQLSANPIILRKRIYSKRSFNVSAIVRKKWQNYITQNFTSATHYENYKPRYSCVNIQDFIKYLPSQEVSMKFSFKNKPVFVQEIGLPESEIEWTQLERYNSVNSKNEVFCFLGAPVTYCAWLPLPEEENHQYILVAYRKDYYKYVKLSNPKRVNTTLMLLKVSPPQDGVKSPTIHVHYSFVIENGPVHSFDFLPSGGYSKKDNRLGLVAVATVSSSIKVYSLPIEILNKQSGGESNLSLIEIKPSFELFIEIHAAEDEQDSGKQHVLANCQCMQVRWSEFEGHKHIFAGFSNGFIGIWDIDDDVNENLNRFEMGDCINYAPLNYFHAGEKGIKCFAIHYDTSGPRWIALSCFHRRLVVYDIVNMTEPIILREDCKRNGVRCMDWCPVWEPFMVGYCDSMPNNGRCVQCFSPTNIMYAQQKMDYFACAVTSVHYTPRLNMCVSSVDNGDVIFSNTKELHYENVLDRKFGDRRVLSSMDIKQLDGQPILKLIGQSFKNKEGSVTELPIADTNPLEEQWMFCDKEFKEKYGLVFHSLVKLTESTKAQYLSDKRRAPLNLVPYMRINTIKWNLNANAKRLVAVGHENGFLRIMNFEKNSYFTKA